MAEKLTVIIPCKDEEANIRGCIHSARKVADEILVADSGSTDRTLEIVLGLGVSRVIHREYVNSGDFKNWAIPQATHRWVLILDADERIPDSLAGEIRHLLRCGPDQDGYWIYRASFFMGHRVRFSGWQNDRVLRLFHRDLGRYQGDTDHAEVGVRSGRVSRLKQRMLHYSYWSYREYFQRMQRYSTYQALKWQEQHRPVNLLKLLFNLPLRFLQLYILRLGFLDGLVGFQVCLLTAIYSFAKQACLWQLLHGRSRTAANRDAEDIQIAQEPAACHHRVPRDMATGASPSGADDDRDAHIGANTDRRAVPLAVAVLRQLRLRYARPMRGTDGCEVLLAQRTHMPEPEAPGADAITHGGRDAQPKGENHGR